MKAKIITGSNLGDELARKSLYSVPVVLITGCFDILHRGHVELIENARRAFPAFEIWVGLNSDRAVRELKGESRPVHDFESRATVMAALSCVDLVFEINDVRVTDFIRAIRPRVWVKGSDYTLETLNQDERKAAEEVGAIIHFVPLLSGYSTTGILAKLNRV